MKNNTRFSKYTLYGSIVGLFFSGSVFAQTANTVVEELIVIGQNQPYRGTVPLEELPQSVQIFDDELLDDMGVVDFRDALDLSSSVARQNDFGGLWDSFAVRGFAGDENVPSGYLVNGFSAGRGYSGVRDASNIQSVEIVKGPGSALFGRSEPGGTINIITKKPTFDQFGYIQASAGSWSTTRLEGDFNIEISDSVAFRVNGASQTSDSYRNSSPEKMEISPSLFWAIDDTSSLTYELELVTQEALFDRGLPALNGDPTALSAELYVGDPQNGPMEINATGHQFTFQKSLDNGWAILAGLGLRSSTFEGYSADTELSGGRQLLLVDGETLSRQRRFRDYDAEDLSGRIEFAGALETGSVTHNLLIGLDAYDFELDTVQERWRTGFGSGDATYSINILNPTYDQAQPATLPQTSSLENQKSTGLYFQDQIDLTEDFAVMVGVRLDDYEQEILNRRSTTVSVVEDTATSKRFGVVYSPSDYADFYASYSEGFRPNSGSDFAGNAFEPEESESIEVGVKFGSSDGSLSGSVVYFEAKKSNVLTADPVNGGFSAALGEAESSGVEVELAKTFGESTDLLLSYAFIDAKTSNDIINFDWGVAIPAGSDLINVPENTLNLTIRHGMSVADMPANIGATMRYVDERLGETIDPTYVLDAYTLVNVFGSVELSDSTQVALQVNNLMDTEYSPNSYHKWWTMPGEPRSFSVSFRYDF